MNKKDQPEQLRPENSKDYGRDHSKRKIQVGGEFKRREDLTREDVRSLLEKRAEISGEEVTEAQVEAAWKKHQAKLEDQNTGEGP